MKNKIRIVTGGCFRYQDPIELSVEQCKKFGYEVEVFNLGDLEIEEATPWKIESEEFKEKGRYHRVPGVGWSAKSLFKPDVILEIAKKYPEDHLLWLDGDAILLEPIDEIFEGEPHDIGIVLRDKRDMQRAMHKRGEWKTFLGIANAGVIAFPAGEKRIELLESWQREIGEADSDQRALNAVCNPGGREREEGYWESGLFKIRGLSEQYNFRYFPELPPKEAKVVHCVGLRFRGRMDILRALAKGTSVLPLRGAEDDFEGFVDLFGWEPHSISNVEAYYIFALIKKYRPDVIIESGICKGRSTHVIAEACKLYKIPFHICLEYSREHEEYIRDKFKDYNIEFHYGQKSDIAMENIIPKIRKYRTLAFVDGPKRYDQSMDLYKQLKRLNTVGVYCHDCSDAGGCYKALSDARTKYWPRAELLKTNKKTNVGLDRFNEPISDELKNAYQNVKEHWSKKLGRELTYTDYCESLACVGIMEVEGK